MRTVLGLYVVLLALHANQAAARQSEQVIFSSDFSNDDTSFFELQQPPPAQLLWDQTRGFPTPGSLRLEQPGTVITEAVSACYPFDPRANYRFEADALAEAESGLVPQCDLVFVTYFEEGCAGPRAIGGESGVGAGWRHVVALKGATVVPSQALSIRFQLQAGAAATTAPHSCNFDNIEIVLEPVGVAEVPALGQVGLVLLALVAAAGGLIVLIRRS